MMIDLPAHYPEVGDVHHRIYIWMNKYIWNDPVSGGRSTQILKALEVKVLVLQKNGLWDFCFHHSIYDIICNS